MQITTAWDGVGAHHNSWYWYKPLQRFWPVFPFSCTSFIRKRTAKKSHGFRNTTGEKYFFSPLEDAVFQENLNAQGLHCGECSQDTFWRMLIKSFLALSFMIAAFCFISYLWGPMLSSGHLLATIYWKLLLFRGEKEREEQEGRIKLYSDIFMTRKAHCNKSTTIQIYDPGRKISV